MTTPDSDAALFGLDLDIELARAHRLADAAQVHTIDLFLSQTFDVDHKDDRSEVTQADRSAEMAMSEIIANECPDHGFIGEEFGRRGPEHASWTWIVDPVDGTSNFVRGIPIWATLVALVHAELGPVLGVVCAPAMSQRWWARRGAGAFTNGRSIHVSATNDWSKAHASLTLANGWDRLGREDALWELGKEVARLRSFGDFWQHMLVAEGALDAAVDAVGLAPYDIAALVPIVEEAGGRFSDHRGDRRIDNSTAITTNGRLHDAILERLSL